MVTETQTQKTVVDVDERDVFVLILRTENAYYETEICGRTMTAWTQKTVEGFSNRRVDIQKSDDIMSIVRANVIDKKYCVVIYADTPLLTRATIDQALGFLATYGRKAVSLPRGWVFETSAIKAGNVQPVDVPNLAAEDFTVAYNLSQIALISTYMRARINAFHMNNGVQITDPYNVYIDADVTIGKGTRIGPGVVLRGETRIGKNCRLTNFVEVKKSVVGDGTKIAHMCYVGDAEIGKNCNIGCGVVFCNYDGKEKHRTTVGNDVFIGSNANLVAPLTLGNKAYVGAGSTITQDVPANALALGRAKQAIKENWRTEQA